MYRLFSWHAPGQKPSATFVELNEVMHKARRYVKGHDLTVINGHFRHPHLSAFAARKLLRAILEKVDFATSVKVVGPNKLLFEVTRVRPNPYLDPFRDAIYSAARIDAGEDLCGNGPVHPIGRAKITHKGTPSHSDTFGDDMSVYQLLEGPAKGLYVYFAEHYDNTRGWRTGKIVETSDVLYHMNGCIEIGWSDGTGSMAWNSGSYHEGELSALGQNFSDLLESLGAKPGLKLGRRTTGKLPAGWPTW